MVLSDVQADGEWELGKLLHDLVMQGDARMRLRLVGTGLTVSLASALRELSGPMTLSELAVRMSCEPSNATFVVDKLERQGLLQRQPDPSDRRAKQLVLTVEGIERRELVLRLLAEDSLFSELTQDAQSELKEVLRRALARA